MNNKIRKKIRKIFRVSSMKLILITNLKASLQINVRQIINIILDVGTYTQIFWVENASIFFKDFKK